MTKRSRDASFSPSAGEISSPASPSDSEESEYPTKINVVADAQFMASTVIQCTLPPHRQPLDFESIDAFEVHYIKDHSNRCSSCGKNFPSTHFLTLHIDENHNPLREELQAKGEKTYGCFVEDCEKKCSTPQKRRLHLIDKHLFPKVYNFRIVDTGIDKSTTMLSESKTHRRRVSTTNAPADTIRRHRRTSSQVLVSNGMSDKQTGLPAVSAKSNMSAAQNNHTTTTSSSKSTQPETSIEELEQSMSSLRFVPPSVLQRQRKPKKS